MHIPFSLVCLFLGAETGALVEALAPVKYARVLTVFQHTCARCHRRAFQCRMCQDQISWLKKRLSDRLEGDCACVLSSLHYGSGPFTEIKASN